MISVQMKNANAPIDVKTSVRGGPIRWLVIGGLLLIAAIAVGTTIMAGTFRDRALTSAEHQLENTVLLMARHFDQQLEDFMAIQRDVVAQIEASRISSPEAFRAQLSSPNGTTCCGSGCAPIPMSPASTSSTPTAC